MWVASFLGEVKPECIDSNQEGSSVGNCPKEVRCDVSCWSVCGLGVHPHCLASCSAWGRDTESSGALSSSCPPNARQVMLSFPKQWSSRSCAGPLIALQTWDLPRSCRQLKQSSRSNLLTSPQVLYYVLNVFSKLIILRSHLALDASLVFRQRKYVYNLVRK